MVRRRGAQTSGSLAEALEERGRLTEREARGVAGQVAAALSRLHERGETHGGVTPDNALFASNGDLVLDDATVGATDETAFASDVTALGVLVLECATGVVVDPDAEWPIADLVDLGCPAELAGDLHLLLHGPVTASHAAAILRRRDDRLPDPPERSRPTADDPPPTIDIASVAISGLAPLGGSDDPAGHD